MKLFGYWRSSATYRVRIAMALKGLDYDYAAVNLLKGEQREASYGDLNPQNLVPALVTDDGATLTQSLAIIEYLEEAFPDPSILPADLADRARARAIAAAIACEAQPFMNLRMQTFLKTERAFDETAMKDWLNRWAGAAMAAVEKIVAQTGGDYCVGDTPTIADACLVPQMYGAARFSVDISAFPRLNEIWKRCNALEAFRKAHPDNQRDATQT